MYNKKIFIRSIITGSLGLFLFIVPAYAEEDINDLKQQIDALNKRVIELEEESKNKPDSSSDYFNEQFKRGGNLFSEFDRMQEEMNRMFQNSFGRRGWPGKGMFKSDMYYDENFELEETDEGYVIKFDVAGLDKDKIDIEVSEYSITISGESSGQTEETSSQGLYSLRSYGSFLKTIPLPVDANTDKIETKKEGDSLIIKMPRK